MLAAGAAGVVAPTDSWLSALGRGSMWLKCTTQRGAEQDLNLKPRGGPGGTGGARQR